MKARRSRPRSSSDSTYALLLLRRSSSSEAHCHSPFCAVKHYYQLACRDSLRFVEPVPSSGPRRAPSIRDVARLAGVGVGTVSRVLNGSPRVSTHTHARVRLAIDELGYTVSTRAR